MKLSQSSSVKLFSVFPLLLFLMLFTTNSDFISISELSKNKKNDNSSTSTVNTCPDPSTISISTLAFSHKIKASYQGTYQVLSWGTSNPQTTNLDYDGGNWAYYHNNGYGYLELEITLSVGGNNCTSNHTIYY